MANIAQALDSRDEEITETAEPQKGLYIRLPEDLHARTKARAALKRVSLQDFVIEAIRVANDSETQRAA